MAEKPTETSGDNPQEDWEAVTDKRKMRRVQRRQERATKSYARWCLDEERHLNIRGLAKCLQSEEALALNQDGYTFLKTVVGKDTVVDSDDEDLPFTDNPVYYSFARLAIGNKYDDYAVFVHESSQPPSPDVDKAELDSQS